ncbi:hypothetical protein NP511_17960 [Natrinema thermotolerans]|uniref:Uncharacterized protein n=1 Tax=Natrinema thermotolerans TaxID=121872 RepID=A0AAF0SYM1_9EURY|nr:hypothetical protein [Natrinema thermotolerans]QCC60242.1 hypothetical protein DVR14_17030 [Natrinema thermotolerans]QCC61154.1 hypothetical protein DVR14_21160 [Natrinema thermotolerans]WMT07261.1 hypothetical protein NP511_17960 [Natrinema thermotolerans]
MYKETYRQNCENWTRAVIENVDFEWHQGDDEDEFVEAVMNDVEFEIEREGRLIKEYAPAEVTAYHLFIKTGSDAGQDIDPNLDDALDFLRVSRSDIKEVDKQMYRDEGEMTIPGTITKHL